MKKGADVIFDELEDVHVRSCFSRRIKNNSSACLSKVFIPVHGEYRHLKGHKDLAVSMGNESRNVLFPELGAQFEMGADYIKQVGFVTAE